MAGTQLGCHGTRRRSWMTWTALQRSSKAALSRTRCGPSCPCPRLCRLCNAAVLSCVLIERVVPTPSQR
eukprot:2310245-Rhodomonas_salina.4